MTHRCTDPDCWFCEDLAETRKAEADGEFMSDHERDDMSDADADRYERELDARWP